VREGQARAGLGYMGATGDTMPGRSSSSSGGASRFFYVAKAAKSEREAGLEERAKVATSEIIGREEGSAGVNSPRAGIRSGARANTHPTVKPVALMRYLVQLVTPPGGVVLDPFAGSGSTLIAVKGLGLRGIGIELSEEYCEIAAGRLRGMK